MSSRRIAFPVMAAVIGATYLFLAFQQIRFGIEFDEGFNLTVVKNMADGVGYATTGIVPWAWDVPFDPNASTGPALVLPGSLVWWLTDGSLWAVRLVPFALFLVMVVTLGRLFNTIGGRWMGLVAAASPLVMSVSRADISTISLVPGRYVGEFTAVSFTVLMVWFAYRRRPLLAGLAGGLAVQTKLNFGLPILVVLIVVIVSSWVQREPRLGSRTGLLVLGLFVPSLLFEVFRLASVGIAGYLPSLKAHISWVMGAVEADPWIEHLDSAGRRFGGLASTLSVGGALLLFIAFLAVLMWAMRGRTAAAPDPVAGQSAGNSSAGIARGRDLEPVIALVAAAAAVLLWWGFVPPEKLPRIGIPIILFGAPVVLTAGYQAFVGLYRGTRDRAHRLMSVISALVAAIAVIFVGSQGWIALTNDFGARMLDEQRAGARALASSGTESLPMDWIWNLAEFQILSGIPSETKPDVAEPTVIVVDAIRARTDVQQDDARLVIPELCGEVLYAAQHAVVCRPKGDG